MRKSVLITGGSGYVGSKLVERLTRSDEWDVYVFESQIFGNPIAHLKGAYCTFLTGDVTNRDDINVAFGVAQPRFVIHLAGVVTDELVDMNAAYGRRVNVGGTYNVAQAAKAHGVKRLLYASSSSVYGSAAEGKVPPTEDARPKPKTEYAQQKLEGEEVVNAISDRVEVVSVRQATACGPAPRMRLDTVVNIFSKQAYYDGVITPYGGEQYRSNVHVADAARFYEHLMKWDQPFKRNVYNLTNHNMKVIDIAKAVRRTASAWGLPDPEILVKDVEDSRSYRLDGDNVMTELAFLPNASVEKAARDNFDWFKASGMNPEDSIYRNNARMGEFVKAK